MDTNMNKDFEEFLNKAKARMTVRIDAYNGSTDVNYFTLDGVRLWLSFVERQRLRLSIAAYEHDGAKEMTKVWNGKSYTFGIETWKDMLAKVEMYASECQNVTERHLGEVQALTSIDAVFAYDYKSDYPERLTFTMDNEQTDKTDDKGTADGQTGTAEQTGTTDGQTETKEGTETEQAQP